MVGFVGRDGDEVSSNDLEGVAVNREGEKCVGCRVNQANSVRFACLEDCLEPFTNSTFRPFEHIGPIDETIRLRDDRVCVSNLLLLIGSDMAPII